MRMTYQAPYPNHPHQPSENGSKPARPPSAPAINPDAELEDRASAIPSLLAKTVAVLGMGYVGLPTAVALATNGFQVLGIDKSPPRLEAIAAGQVDLTTAERDRLAAELQDGHLRLSSEPALLAQAEVVLVCVPTPVDAELRPDYRLLKAACDTVVAHARPGQTFVMTSTAHVGSTRELLVTPLEERELAVGEEVFVCFSPERINPGVPEHTQATTPRIIGGYSPECVERATEALSYTCLSLHAVSSLEAAEMTKLYENTFRAVNIALAFEIADACDNFGLDPIEVTRAAATKPYAFMAHYPSAGVGGHCIGVDPYYLLWPLRAQGAPMTMTEEALALISSRPHRVAERALSLLSERHGSARGAHVLIVGAAYKPGVADTREAPALKIIAELRRAGAEVGYFDPLIPAVEIDGHHYEHNPDPRGGDFDLVVLTTIHPDVDYDWLDDCEDLLDCTYRTASERVRHLV
jgi:UDP-N-acetyl-D-glucosamine dehydrogenase